jgi:Uma2 family endonuclease
LHGVPWRTYEFLLYRLDGQGLRITYDQGELEIMTLSLEHESWGAILGALIQVLTMELDIPIRSGGSTTLRRAFKKKGLEPDECYWIENERLMRGKKDFDSESDPPPDLAVEIDITHSSLDRMGIYAALRVPEVWRFDGELLRVYLLGANAKYKESASSRAFPFLPIHEIERFLHDGTTTDETTLMRVFSKWVRETILPQFKSSKSKKNGKKPRK